MAECFIVMGMARSGTSVTTGLLHRLGVVMGWELELEPGQSERFDWPDPQPMNPRGFYQDAPLENALYEIWGDDYPPAGARPGAEDAGHVAEFKRLLRLRAERGHPRWGFKASHTPWVVPEIVETLSDHDLRFVVTNRPSDESIRSMRAWFEDYTRERCEEWCRRVEGQVNAVLAAYPSIPRHTLPFADLHDQTPATVRGLARFAGVPASQAALSFVDPLLRRVR